MPELARPINVLELQDGESRSFRVVRFETGEEIIRPAHAPNGKRVRVLRLHVSADDKPDFPHYWDVTSTRLYAQLLPQLQVAGLLSAKWTITARGIQPKKYFTVERVRS